MIDFFSPDDLQSILNILSSLEKRANDEKVLVTEGILPPNEPNVVELNNDEQTEETAVSEHEKDSGDDDIYSVKNFSV